MTKDQAAPAARRAKRGSTDDQSASSLLPQLRSMGAALIRSPARLSLALLVIGLALVVVATAYGQVRLNRWNRPFYDALSHHDLRGFLHQLVVFGVIAGTLLVLNVGQQWLSQMLSLKLRAGLVHDLVEHWLQPRRAFRLAHAGPLGVNPDQRMHEDARHLTELSATLGVGLMQSSVLLGAFVAVLWQISSGFGLPVGSHILTIPGYMVWAAIVYAGSASLLSWWVGHGLIARNAERYAREADLRFSLVRVNEHIDAIALAGGEADEQRHIERDLTAVLHMMRRLVSGLTNLTWVTAGYGWFTLIAPILAAAPLYFHGQLSFGGLMMAAGAFNQVQSSLRWFVDNFSTIADWRATLLRVAAFRQVVVQTDRFHSVQSRIEFVDGDPDRLAIEKLQISSPDGCTLLEEGSAQIKAGEHVLIAGEPDAGKTLLFRALAGLWVWGSGRIVLPRDGQMLFIPRRAYLPPGNLRQVLAYPRPVDSFQKSAFGAALKCCGLEQLARQLDESAPWERQLSDAQQTQLAIARAVLHAPGWIIIDELFESLSREAVEGITEVLSTELKHTAVIYIGSELAQHSRFSRVLHLKSKPSRHRLTRETAAAA